MSSLAPASSRAISSCQRVSAFSAAAFLRTLMRLMRWRVDGKGEAACSSASEGCRCLTEACRGAGFEGATRVREAQGLRADISRVRA